MHRHEAIYALQNHIVQACGAYLPVQAYSQGLRGSHRTSIPSHTCTSIPFAGVHSKGSLPRSVKFEMQRERVRSVRGIASRGWCPRGWRPVYPTGDGVQSIRPVYSARILLTRLGRVVCVGLIGMGGGCADGERVAGPRGTELRGTYARLPTTGPKPTLCTSEWAPALHTPKEWAPASTRPPF